MVSEPTDPDTDGPNAGEPSANDPYADLEQPSRRGLHKELRSVSELVRLASSGKRLLREGSRGNHELVVVYPGFGTGDSATALLRAYLTNRGFSTRGWRLGRNHGDVAKLLPKVIERLEYELRYHRLPEESGSTEVITDTSPLKARLVGWSLGGYIAREVARDRPDLVEQVITFGTPVVGGPKYTVSAPTYRDRGDDVDAIAAEVDERNKRLLTVPVTAIFSKSDRVVDWRACIDHLNPDVEHVEIDGPHAGMPINPDVFDLVARSLASRSSVDHSSVEYSSVENSSVENSVDEEE